MATSRKVSWLTSCLQKILYLSKDHYYHMLTSSGNHKSSTRQSFHPSSTAISHKHYNIRKSNLLAKLSSPSSAICSVSLSSNFMSLNQDGSECPSTEFTESLSGEGVSENSVLWKDQSKPSNWAWVTTLACDKEVVAYTSITVTTR